MQGFKEELKHWDVSFWAERLREAKYDIRDEDLRPYFPLERVLDGLFAVCALSDLTLQHASKCACGSTGLFVGFEAIGHSCL